MVIAILVLAGCSNVAVNLPENDGFNYPTDDQFNDNSLGQGEACGVESDCELTGDMAYDLALKSSCAEVGSVVKEGYFFNPNSDTYWFGLVLAEEKPGCNPACVVNGNTGAVEVNWRCTGLIAD